MKFFITFLLSVLLSVAAVSAEEIVVPEGMWNQLTEEQREQLNAMMSDVDDSITIVTSDVGDEAFFGPFRKNKAICEASCMVSLIGLGVGCGAITSSTGGIAGAICGGFTEQFKKICEQRCENPN